MNYFKILRFLQKGDKDYFGVDVKEERVFINAFKEPTDDIDRGYYQYLCQNYLVSYWKIVFLNAASLLILPLLLLFFLVKRIWVKSEGHIDSLVENKGMPEVIPEVVNTKYKPDSNHWNNGSSLSVGDVCFIFKLINRAPFHPYFVLKAMMNITHYSDMIKRYSPKVMIQFGEFSFSSSILTSYCHLYGVKHINIMHGEKMFFIRDAFFHYDECYVWSNHYVKIFHKLRAESSQFVIQVPPSLVIDSNKYLNVQTWADYKYYLSIYTEDEIKGIVRSLEFIEKGGKTVKYRPHPRYSNLELLKKYVPSENIELPNEVSIQESISNLNFAIGSFSTVLTQAYYSGKSVILDDMTYSNQFNKLAEMDYMLASVSGTFLLSSCQ